MRVIQDWTTKSCPKAHRRALETLAIAYASGIRGGAPEGDGEGEGGDSAPPADDTAGKVAKANERARKAEARAKAAEQKAREREESDARQKRDAELKDAESAKAALSEAEKREKAALARLSAFEERETARIDGLLERLPAEERERVGKYRERLGDDFGAFVEEELGRHGSSSPAAESEALPVNPPPPANPGAVMRRDVGKGRNIQPWAQERLDEMGIDTTASRNSLVVEKDPSGAAKFIFPPTKMKTMLRDRAVKPALLTSEEYDKLHGR